MPPRLASIRWRCSDRGGGRDRLVGVPRVRAKPGRAAAARRADRRRSDARRLRRTVSRRLDGRPQAAHALTAHGSRTRRFPTSAPIRAPVMPPYPRAHSHTCTGSCRTRGGIAHTAERRLHGRPDRDDPAVPERDRAGCQRGAAAAADLRRPAARTAAGRACRDGRAEGAQRDHARRARRRRGHLDGRRLRSLGNVDRLHGAARPGRSGAARGQSGRRRLRPDVEPPAAGGALHDPGRRRGRIAAARLDGRISARPERRQRQDAGSRLPRSVGAQPVRGRLRRPRSRQPLADSLQLGRGRGAPTSSASASRRPTWSAMPSARAVRKCRTSTPSSTSTIGALLERLDALVGRDRYVVALTADHGVSLVARKERDERQDAGRVSTARIAEQLERAAQAAASGPGSSIARVNGSDVYFTDGSVERSRKRPRR